MKALVLDQPGTPETLRLTDLALPEPGPLDVRVRVRAAGLNPVDYKVAAGGHPRWRYPFVLGLDVAGTVDLVGSEVRDFVPGEEVLYHGDLSRPGGYAEYACTAAHVLIRKPKALSFEAAAALPCAGFTAYQVMQRKLRLRPGETVLIHGGAGGVGGFCLQLARRFGLRTVTTCSAANILYVTSLGADLAIDYQTENIAVRVREFTDGRGVDAVVDTVSGESATAAIELVAYGGAIACLAGFLDFQTYRRCGKSLAVHAVALGAAYGDGGDLFAQRDLARMGTELVDYVVAGEIDPMLAETIPLEAVADGLARLAARHVRGKIVADPAL